MLEVGSLVKSKYTILGHNARTGIVIQMREGAYENEPLAKVFWFHRRDTGWVEAKDMEVVDESR